MQVVRFVVLCLIALLLLSVVIGAFAPNTGTAEKVALAGLGALLIYAASVVRGLGPRTEPR